ncbi:DUF427 domain-containing protein [Limibacter armeniacum]|uniref:DUF427 domain-containing protein n=1 Tax=Limibacter armeniacum TaxID=466084 RepID=UPI002FE57888
MKKASWKGKVIAESDKTVEVEGDFYFPPTSIHQEYFEKSDETSMSPSKGKASYYNIVVDGEKNEAAAWYYAHPKSEAKDIKNYVAFKKGVEIE